MAEHGVPEYATAPGNDYPTHEANYRNFVHLAFIGTVHVVNIVLGLAIGGVAGHWMMAFGVFVVATIAAVQGFLSGTRTSSYVALVVSLVTLAFAAS